MDYNTFVEQVCEAVSQKLGSQHEVTLQHIWKNNGLELDAIVVKKMGENISPNIYVEYYYQRWCEGETLDEVAEEIVEVYTTALKDKPKHIDAYLRYEDCRQRIFCRLVNYEKNKENLKKVPYIRKWDLAITFHCLVHENEQGMQSFCVTECMREQWNVPMESLYAQARENTYKLFPPRIETLEDVLDQLCFPKQEERSLEKNLRKFSYWEILEYWEDSLPERQMEMPFVITNLSKLNGATAILYPGVLEMISKKCDSDLYLLPSSIHEFLALPANSLEPEALEKMVKQVNRTEVATEEVLSDTVYFYDRKKKKVSIQQSSIEV